MADNDIRSIELPQSSLTADDFELGDDGNLVVKNKKIADAIKTKLEAGILNNDLNAVKVSVGIDI